MKVKELITELQKHDPEKEVMIQQGEEYDYMTVCTVKEKDLYDSDSFYDCDNDKEITAVVIEYN